MFTDRLKILIESHPGSSLKNVLPVCLCPFLLGMGTSLIYACIWILLCNICSSWKNLSSEHRIIYCPYNIAEWFMIVHKFLFTQVSSRGISTHNESVNFNWGCHSRGLSERPSGAPCQSWPDDLFTKMNVDS